MCKMIEFPDLPVKEVIAFDESVEIRGFTEFQMRKFAAETVALNCKRTLLWRLLQWLK